MAVLSSSFWRMRIGPAAQVTDISFIHHGGETWASYRYRARRPAEALGASLNDPTAATLVFVKPMGRDHTLARDAKARSQRIVFDVCDDHFQFESYRAIAELADALTCPTPTMADRLRERGYTQPITVVPDPYEFEERPSHVTAGRRLLWFGHVRNTAGLRRVAPLLTDCTLEVVSNFPGSIPWSIEALREAFARADLVILPQTEPWKSPNRALEAIRQGCAVVAEPHPSLTSLPGVYIGDIPDGIDRVTADVDGANEQVRTAQDAIRVPYALETCAEVWRDALRVPVLQGQV